MFGGKQLAHSQSAAPVYHIPSDMTFLFAIRRLEPNYAVQEAQSKGDDWVPPTKRNAYTSGPENIYRWSGGIVQPLGGSSFPSHYQVFDSASVFVQSDTDHLVAVGFDAQRQNVKDHPAGWRRLSFEHRPVNNTMKTYSFISIVAPEGRIAAPGPRHWRDQLLPRIYDYRHSLDAHDRIIPARRQQAGLIGELPLLLALAAFSAPPSSLDQALTGSMQPGVWRRHGLPSGHIDQRGIVVTVYLDPSNAKGSTAALLRRLEAGVFGPFYGP